MVKNKKSKHGARELLYFLSRHPTAEYIDDWFYDTAADKWRHPTQMHSLPIKTEAQQSVAVCISQGLTVDAINTFLRVNQHE